MNKVLQFHVVYRDSLLLCSSDIEVVFVNINVNAKAKATAPRMTLFFKTQFLGKEKVSFIWEVSSFKGCTYLQRGSRVTNQ